jgi:hypothetical protein
MVRLAPQSCIHCDLHALIHVRSHFDDCKGLRLFQDLLFIPSTSPGNSQPADKNACCQQIQPWREVYGVQETSQDVLRKLYKHRSACTSSLSRLLHRRLQSNRFRSSRKALRVPPGYQQACSGRHDLTEILLHTSPTHFRRERHRCQEQAQQMRNLCRAQGVRRHFLLHPAPRSSK